MDRSLISVIGDVAQLVEQTLAKGCVTGSSPVVASRIHAVPAAELAQGRIL